MVNEKLEKKITEAMTKAEEDTSTVELKKITIKRIRALGRSGESIEDIVSNVLLNFYYKEMENICRECGSGMTEEDGKYVCIACGHTYNKNSKVKK